MTTTFDVLVERAVDDARFEGQRQTLSFAYAPNDKQDLPPEFDRLNRPAVFHLFGKISGTPHSYAVTAEDRIDFLRSLDAKTEDSPGFLFDKLRGSDLMIMGTGLGSWLVRLVRQSSIGRVVEPPGDAAEYEREDESRVLFVPHGGEPEVLRGPAAEFVDELAHRWAALARSEDAAAGPDAAPPPELFQLLSTPPRQPGVVFLSSIEADRAAAESIRGVLDRAGVDTLLDRDDRRLSPRWDLKLRSLLDECALFVPLVSRRSVGAARRFFRPEWVEAILEAGKNAPSGRFILPVALDDAPADEALPGAFGDLSWERLPDGQPTPELVKTVVELQRSFRSARFE